MPVLEIQLEPGERVVSEPGELAWMSSSIQLKTSTQMAGARGFMGALKRALGGGSLFLTEYSAQGAPGSVHFAAKFPGQILDVECSVGKGYLVHRHGFLCGLPGIQVGVGFQRSLGAGIFGGEGFILQKLGGNAQAWVELSGEVVVRDLQVGETLRVHPGHVGMFEEGVGFDIVVLPGIRNVLFGGDGLFLAALTGPGRVWLQSLPLPNLAHALSPYLHVQAEGAAAGGIGGALGAMMAGR